MTRPRTPKILLLALGALGWNSVPTLANAAEPPAPAPAPAPPAPTPTPSAPEAAPTPTNQAPAAPAPPPAGAGVAAPESAEPPSRAEEPALPPATPDESSRELRRAAESDPSTTPVVTSRTAATATEDETVLVDDGSRGSHQRHTYLALGYRLTRVASDGFEPFSQKPALNQLSVLAGSVLGVSEALSFALGAGWDYGGSSADVRGAVTSLRIHRFTLVPELRYHLLRRLYAFGRLGAGVALVHADLEDAVIAARRTSDSVSFSVDPSVGLAVELIGEASGASRQPRVWALLDAGYLFTTTSETVLANESSAPARTDDYSLGDLGLSGPSARLAVAFSF